MNIVLAIGVVFWHLGLNTYAQSELTAPICESISVVETEVPTILFLINHYNDIKNSVEPDVADRVAREINTKIFILSVVSRSNAQNRTELPPYLVPRVCMLRRISETIPIHPQVERQRVLDSVDEIYRNLITEEMAEEHAGCPT